MFLKSKIIKHLNKRFPKDQPFFNHLLLASYHHSMGVLYKALYRKLRYGAGSREGWMPRGRLATCGIEPSGAGGGGGEGGEKGGFKLTELEEFAQMDLLSLAVV